MVNYPFVGISIILGLIFIFGRKFFAKIMMEMLVANFRNKKNTSEFQKMVEYFSVLGGLVLLVLALVELFSK